MCSDSLGLEYWRKWWGILQAALVLLTVLRTAVLLMQSKTNLSGLAQNLEFRLISDQRTVTLIGKLTGSQDCRYLKYNFLRDPPACVLLCDKTFPGGHNTYFYSTQRDPRTDQSRNTTKVQSGKSMSFIGITYSNVCEGLLIAAAMTQRQQHQQSPLERG